MKIDLIVLLDSHRMAHPTRIERVTFTREALEIGITGYPWWRDEKKTGDSGVATMRFENVSEGFFDLDVFDKYGVQEELESLAVTRLAMEEWAWPSEYNIYCYAPLGDPMKLYTEIESYLDAANAFKNPTDFLNEASSVSKFQKNTSARMYLLASVPNGLKSIICEEIERQNVPYTIYKTGAHPRSDVVIRLGSAGFFCTAATLEFAS